MGIQQPRRIFDNQMFHPSYQETLYSNEDAYFTFDIKKQASMFKINVVDVAHEISIGTVTFPFNVLFHKLNAGRDSVWVSLYNPREE